MKNINEELDTIVIVDGKPMWKKDYIELTKNYKLVYFAVVLTKNFTFWGDAGDMFVYICKLEKTTKKSKFDITRNDCFLNEIDLTNEDYDRARNYAPFPLYGDNKKGGFNLADLEKYFKYSSYSEMGYHIIENFEEAVKKFSNDNPGTNITIEKKYLANEFQYHIKCDHVAAEWQNSLSENVCKYIKKLNTKCKTKKTSVNSLKEYKLVEI